MFNAAAIALSSTNNKRNAYFYFVYFFYLPFVALILLGGSYLVVTVNIHAASWLIASVINLVLALLVYSKDRTNSVNRGFAIMTLFCAVWTIDVFGFFVLKSASQVIVWSKILRPGYLFLAPLYFQFALALTQGVNPRTKRLLYVSYGIAIFFLMLNYVGCFDGVNRRQWMFAPRIGYVYGLSLINFGFWIFFGLYFIIKKYVASHSIREKTQYRLFFLGLVMASTPALVSNTLLGLGIRIYPIGGFCVIAYALIVAYAIVKYQFMDIEVLIRKSIVYGSLTLSLMSIYVAIVGFLIGVLHINYYSEISNVIANGSVGVIIAAVFLPLKNKIQLIVDKSFFKDKYNYQTVLKNLSSQLTSILETDMLLEQLLAKVTDAMHISRGCILLLDKENSVFEIKASKHIAERSGGMYPDQLHGLSQRLQQGIINFNDHITEKNNNWAVPDETCLAIPLMTNNKIIGMFCLGDKLSEDMYTHEDIELLMTISSQASIAIENAQLSAGIRSLEKGLLQSDKLAALGTFASSMAHEIKNPLAAIKTFCQLVSRKFGDPGFVDKFNAVVPGEIERLESVLSQLLDFSKISEEEYSSVKVEEILDGLLILLQYETFKHNVKVVRQYGATPQIMASEKHLKQIFMNLILNAIQAMSHGGSLHITTGVIHEAAGQNVVIAVKDTGCGIAKEHLDKIFKPFFTTKANGTGLGLSIISKLIREHHGTMKIDSELGVGTVCTMTFPLTGAHCSPL
jgi:signal transduction histidine kinase